MRNSAMELTWFKWDWIMTLLHNDEWFVPPSLSSISLILTIIKSLKSGASSCVAMLQQRGEAKRRKAMLELGQGNPSDRRETDLGCDKSRDTEFDDGARPVVPPAQRNKTPLEEPPPTGPPGVSDMSRPDRAQSNSNERQASFSCC